MWNKIYNKLRFITYLWYKSIFYAAHRYKYDGLKIRTHKMVFHPGLLYSTKNLYQFLKKIDVENTNLLELGAGTGLIALDCIRRGAEVTATDINPYAIEVLKKNAEINNLNLKIIESDLFDNIPQQVFNHIIINPPYYKTDPTTEIQKAFYAGSNFEYFSKLFRQLPEYVTNDSSIYMILADNCNIDEIKQIAKGEDFEFYLKDTIKHYQEENYIFLLSRNYEN